MIALRTIRFKFAKGQFSRTILYIDRPVFDYEVENLRNNSDILFIPLSARVAKDCFSSIMGSGAEQINDYNYQIEIKRHPQNLTRLRDFWCTFFRVLKFCRAIDGVLGCHFIYTLQMELQWAAKYSGIPFIIIQRESILPQGQLKWVQKTVYKNSIAYPAFFLFYNKPSLSTFLQIPGINENNSTCVGFPRIDRLVDAVKAPPKLRNQVTLFYSVLEAKSVLFPQSTFSTIRPIVERFVLNFIRLARSHQNTKFILKFKQTNHIGDFDQLCDLYNEEPLPSNIEIVGQGDPIKLLTESQAIATFNSTVAVEALAGQCRVVEPALPDDFDTKEFSYLGSFPGTSIYVSTVEEMAKALFTVNDDAEQYRAERNAALRSYFGFLDGQNTSRVVSELLQKTNNSSRPRMS